MALVLPPIPRGTTQPFVGQALYAGGNYTVPPTVTISGGGGTGAAFTAVLTSSGQVSGFTQVSGGTGYTTLPTVTLPGGARAVPTIGGGAVTALAVEPVNLTTVTDLRWLLKAQTTDPDRFAVVTKTLAAGQITFVTDGTDGQYQFTLTPADTGAPALTPAPGPLVAYVGIKVFLPGTPPVEYDLLGGQVLPLTLIQGEVFAIT
ncbi:MAG TPA: hypothetical protein VN837_05605 [Chloroflexota bacterium]|nr:hypothetical protein [Chloroflexota bacterium]